MCTFGNIPTMSYHYSRLSFSVELHNILMFPFASKSRPFESNHYTNQTSEISFKSSLKIGFPVDFVFPFLSEPVMDWTSNGQMTTFNFRFMIFQKFLFPSISLLFLFHLNLSLNIVEKDSLN